MKIDGLSKAVSGLLSGENRQKVQPSAQQQPGAGQSKVELSRLSSSLAKAEATIASTPEVDRQRVDEIRQAISEGRFKVDPERIADGLLDNVREMFSARS